MRNLRQRILLIACVLIGCIFSQQISYAQTVEVIRLTLGETEIIDVDFELSDIIIGSENIARASLLSDRSFVITPVSEGSTQITLRDNAGQSKRILSIIITENFSQLQAIINDIIPGAPVTVKNVNGRALVSGTVVTDADADRVIEIAQSYSQGDVINALKIADPRQVMLRVNILELTRSGGKELGIQWFRSTSGVQPVDPSSFSVVVENLNFSLAGNAYNIDLLLQALETKGAARRLANPTLVSVNGSTASFVVGGEVPIVSTDGEGNTTTDYREYGVKLAFSPQVLPSNTIRLNILPEVSEVDWSRRVNDNPAFISRKVETTIELKSGSSFAIAGLLQRDSVNSVRQFPWLGNVPILGALFRSAEYQNNETELVVVVTPYLVNENSVENLRANPTLQSRAPSDAQAFLEGAIENQDEMVRRFRSGFGITGSYGHILPSR